MTDAFCLFVGWLIVTPAVALAIQDANIILVLLGILHFGSIPLICPVGFIVWVMLIRIIVQLLLGVGFTGHSASFSHRHSPFSIEGDASELLFRSSAFSVAIMGSRLPGVIFKPYLYTSWRRFFGTNPLHTLLSMGGVWFADCLCSLSKEQNHLYQYIISSWKTQGHLANACHIHALQI